MTEFANMTPRQQFERQMLIEHLAREAAPGNAMHHAEALALALRAEKVNARAWRGGRTVRVYIGSAFVVVGHDASVTAADSPRRGERGTYLPSGAAWRKAFAAYLDGSVARAEANTARLVAAVAAAT